MKNNCSAFTLIELLITISIISIIVTQALPSFAEFLEKRKVSANTQRLVQTLKISRTTAISEKVLVTICPTEDGQQCGTSWSSGYFSFKDINGNRQFDGDDEKIVEFISHDEKNSLSWRAFGIRKSLQWLQTGITNHQNGSFELCYDNKEQLARGLFITKAGRVRFSKDSNGDGIHENSTGGTIQC